VELVPRDPDELDAVTVLWKNPRMREGLSDLPWHRDCGMGGHAVNCPAIVCSVFLEPNRAEGGALRFLPGSWRCSYRFGDGREADAPQGVLPPAQPGDLTLHYGDVWHVAPPPTGDTGPFRCCALVSFHRPDARHHRGERHYNDVLLGQQDGQVADLRQVARARG
jgi:ectoine hydroxylase-related dioxygenase (phytanoyl-CoA dioxygenase family)